MNDKTKKWIKKLKQTREKRKSQVCKVYEIKLDKSHLSKEKKLYLNRLFLEAKWLYNSILSSENIFDYNTKVKGVFILNKNKEKEIRNLDNISAQMKQAIKRRTIGSIKALSSKKKKGKSEEVGKLKFKSQVNSIVLDQFNITYKIENEKYIKLQNFKKHLKVLGLKQIPENVEFANATLIRKDGDYYIKITCYLPKENREKTEKVIGLDFGIKDSTVDSNGNKDNFQFPETKAIKKASRKLNKCKKGSKNRYKVKLKLQKKYQKNNNRKKDAKNKFVSKLKKDFDIICIQDEQIHNWAKSKMKGFGRRIQYSIMGGIISELKKHSETVIVDRFFPSTKLCPKCGSLNKLTLADRIYICDCGYSQDRDIHSARNILIEGLKQIGREPINTMPGEKILDYDKTFVFDKQFSMKQEALSFR